MPLTDDIQGMRDTQEYSMMDEGVRLIRSESANSYGEPIVTYKEGESTNCGIEFQTHREAHSPEMTIVTYDAILRLPIGYTISEKDRFKLTSYRHDVYEMVFEVATPVQKGISCNRVMVNRVET